MHRGNWCASWKVPYWTWPWTSAADPPHSDGTWPSSFRQLFIPRGFAHGFAVLSPRALFQYKCDAPYAPQSEGAIAWNDPQIGIDWRLDPADVLLSEKDSRHPRLDEAPELFDYNTDYYAQR